MGGGVDTVAWRGGPVPGCTVFSTRRERDRWHVLGS